MSKILDAALLIAFDSGMISANTTWESILPLLKKRLENFTPDQLEKTEAWLATLSIAELDNVCCGEQPVAGVPDYVNQVLNGIL